MDCFSVFPIPFFRNGEGCRFSLDVVLEKLAVRLPACNEREQASGVQGRGV